MEPKVIDDGQNIIIKWQFSKIVIPSEGIKEVLSDDTYGGNDPKALRIGFPYGSTDRVLLRTNEGNYLIYTSNPHTITKKLKKYVQ
ncbi:hypothetical protein SAMN04487944_1243 [Gracilibacillus ureilyticus]|uniref:Sublancin immunity protein SunI-like PH domain-containing protein n=1 Tax=Gracilibacillus ureilyticus TaxID=531814 RepID=A0A1H9VJ42_9BACI|nr:hypothetical protein [Gracilibacillus ureilyticus]SES21327.1 hypothetical protein SAMN04487944_1243 [Gracilibacillus ureilyticus]